MHFFLLKLTTNGVKNISEDVSLAFYRETGIDTITFLAIIFGPSTGRMAVVNPL